MVKTTATQTWNNLTGNANVNRNHYEIFYIMPFISIIIPIYKVEHFLKECLDSIIVSPSDCWEAILVDDGSPDNCPTICNDYAARDHRFRVIHQKNSGVAAARNAGLDMAKGEWVWFVDSDDMVDMHFVADIVTWLKSHKEADFVMFDLNTFKDGKEKPSSPHDTPSLPPISELGRNDFFLRYITYNHQQVWYRKSSQFRFTYGIRVSEDLELMYKYCMLCQHPVKFDALLYYYRIRGNSATQNASYQKVTVEDLPLVFNNLLIWIQKYQIKPEAWLDFRLMKMIQNLLYHASQIQGLDIDVFQNQIRRIITDYRKTGFPFANVKKYKLAERNVKVYFLLNKFYLKIIHPN
mgnify:CR=1 FL=1